MSAGTLGLAITQQNNRPAVLFLHGFMGSRSDWTRTTDALKHDFRCVAMDLPGHGSSTGLPDAAYTVEGAARLILRSLDALGIERPTIVGYSMGGRLALYFALRHPERCSKLFLESTSPGIKDAAARQARRATDEERAMRLETDDLEAFLWEWYTQPLFSSLARDRDLLIRTVETRRRNDPLELARALRGTGTGIMPPLWSELAGLCVPTLAVAGELDEKFVAIARRMAASTPSIKDTSIQNAGHNVHLEAHSAHLELLRWFLET